MNNPVNDCEKAKALLLDEIARWHSLPDAKRRLFASLLKDRKEFEGFLSMVGAVYANKGISELISNLYVNKICQHAELDMLIKQYPCELAYALALIDTINSFIKNLLLDNLLLVDIYNRAKKLHIDADVRRVVMIPAAIPES